MTDQQNHEEDDGLVAIHKLLLEYAGVDSNSPRPYDEQQELMSYVWRNYPEIVRPHECVASHEQIRDRLPAELRDEYWQHALECRNIIRGSRERDQQPSEEWDSMISMPILPSLRQELLELVMQIQHDLEIEFFKERFTPHQDQVTINRCPKCAKILINQKTRQCLWCGHDWS